MPQYGMPITIDARHWNEGVKKTMRQIRQAKKALRKLAKAIESQKGGSKCAEQERRFLAPMIGEGI